MTIQPPPEKLYEKFGFTYSDLSQFNISTTNELTAPQNKIQYEKEIRRLKKKASLEGRSLTFSEIKRLDYIAQKRAEKTRPDKTPYRTGSQTYRYSQKEPTGNGSHRRAGKTPSEF